MFCGIAQQLPEKIGTDKNGTRMVCNYRQRISLVFYLQKTLACLSWKPKRYIWSYLGVREFWTSFLFLIGPLVVILTTVVCTLLFGILKKDKIENERLTCRKRCMHLGSWHCLLAFQCRGRCSWKSRSGFCKSESGSGETPELGNDLVPVNPEVSKQLVLRQRGKSSRVCSRHLGGIILLR